MCFYLLKTHMNFICVALFKKLFLAFLYEASGSTVSYVLLFYVVVLITSVV